LTLIVHIHVVEKRFYITFELAVSNRKLGIEGKLPGDDVRELP
jgi:hypothetical protein